MRFRTVEYIFVCGQCSLFFCSVKVIVPVDPWVTVALSFHRLRPSGI